MPGTGSLRLVARFHMLRSTFPIGFQCISAGTAPDSWTDTGQADRGIVERSHHPDADARQKKTPRSEDRGVTYVATHP